MDKHITVLTRESVEALAIKHSSTVVDATFGGGGHARHIVESLGSQGCFIGIDADPKAIEKGKKLFQKTKTMCATHLCVGNFRNIDTLVSHLDITEVDGILADLGWRMEQFSGNGKGFSFQVDEPLIMTFGDEKEYPFTARDIINDWSEEALRNVLKGYGEERFAGRIARTIVEARMHEPIATTFELVAVIKKATPLIYHRGRIHPATRTFQALRIAVNDEFDALETFIKKSIALLKKDGRLAIISFHSLEDRIVKHTFKNLAHDHGGVVITKRPITATEEELKDNPRARSAKLRIFQKNEEI